MKNEIIEITTQDVERRLISLRGQRVLLDRDVAALYGVETKRLNEAVKNNPDKFPNGYLFPLQQSEIQQLVENFDRFKASRMRYWLPARLWEYLPHRNHLASLRWSRLLIVAASSRNNPG